MSTDEKFMQVAIDKAKEAPFPFGAVLVKDGKIIAESGSGSEDGLDPTAHAEINVIRTACQKLQTRTLEETTLYTTCEPCPMCFTAAWFANITRIVYGVSLEESAKLFGGEIEVGASFLNQKGGQKIQLTGGMLKNEVLEMYRVG